MDELQDYIDQTQIRVNRGENFTANDEASLMKANRRLLKLQQQQEQINPYTGLIDDAQQQRTQREAELSTRRR